MFIFTTSKKPYRNYITDDNAGDGNIGSIDLTGTGKQDRDEIALIINAPNKHIKITTCSINETWLAMQVRACKSLTIEKYHAYDFWNDGAQLCANNITILNAQIESELRKVYSKFNHPDGIQLFSWDKVSTLSNINIPMLDIYLRNTAKHGVLHWTENHISEKMFIGDKWMNIDTDATEYDYWLSALVLRHCMIGNPDANVSGKKFRISDVKHLGEQSYDNYFAGMSRESAILDDQNSVMFV